MGQIRSSELTRKLSLGWGRNSWPKGAKARGQSHPIASIGDDAVAGNTAGLIVAVLVGEAERDKLSAEDDAAQAAPGAVLRVVASDRAVVVVVDILPGLLVPLILAVYRALRCLRPISTVNRSTNRENAAEVVSRQTMGLR